MGVNNRHGNIAVVAIVLIVLAILLLAGLSNSGMISMPDLDGDNPTDPEVPGEDPPNIPDVDYLIGYLPGTDADNAVAYILPQISVVQDSEGYIPVNGTSLSSWTPTSFGDYPDLPAHSLANPAVSSPDMALRLTINGPLPYSEGFTVSGHYGVNITAADVQQAPGGTLSIPLAFGVPGHGIYSVYIYWFEYRESGMVSRWDTFVGQITV